MLAHFLPFTFSIDLQTGAIDGRCCINRARSVDIYARRSRGQPPIKSDSRVTA
ncbi:MAG: hypothetical protein V3Q69_13915 (plasmid) [Burkholderia sp.]